MYLPYITPLEGRRHRLEEVIHAAPYAVLKRTLELFHVDVQANIRAVACIPRFFRGEQCHLRIERIPCCELLIARAMLPEGAQPLGEDLVVEMRRRIACLAYECLRPRKRLTLGRERERDLMLAHLGQIVLEHLVGKQLEDVLSAEIHIAAEAKLLDDELAPPILRHRLHAEVKVRRAAAEVKHTVGDLLARALRLKPIRLKGTDRVCSGLICTVVHAETTHHIRIVEESLRQRLSETALKALADVLTYALLIAHGEGKDIVEIDAAMHIVDVESEIVGIDLDGIEAARVERLRLRIRLDLLNVAVPILQDRGVRRIARPAFQLAEHGVVDSDPLRRLTLKDRIRRLMRCGHLRPLRIGASLACTVELLKLFNIDQLNRRRVLIVLNRRLIGVVALADA